MQYALSPMLSVAPALDAPPPCEDASHVCVGADALPALNEETDFSDAVGRLPDNQLLLVLRPAIALAAALLVVRERDALLVAFERLRTCECSDALSALPQPAVAALLRLELQELGKASDLTTFAGAPREWTWLRWRSGIDTVSVVSRGQHITARRLRPEPRMAFVRGFLSEAECAHIIRLGKDGGALHPSRVVNHERKAGDPGGVRSAFRTSESCRVSAMQDRVVRRVVQRAAYLAGLAPEHAEAVQVVHYEETQQYRPHYDYFSPESPGYAERIGPQGNRLISFFAYLAPCDAGGKTVFPKLRLGFAPEVGCAVMWYNMDRHGNLDERTLHAGEPVSSGEKWGLNVWLRERPRGGAKRGPKAVKAALTLSAAGDTAVDVSDVASAVLADQLRRHQRDDAPGTIRVRLQLTTQAPPPPMILPCKVCGDRCGPVGLCLCRDKYVF